MFLFKDFKKYILLKKELNYLYLIFFGVIFATIIEMLSLSIIVPVFNIVFLNKGLENISLFKEVDFNHNLQIISLLVFLLVFFIKNIFLIAFNYFYINFFISRCGALLGK